MTDERALSEEAEEKTQSLRVWAVRKAREVLGWEPEVGPREGVAMLASWVEKNKERVDEAQDFVPKQR